MGKFIAILFLCILLLPIEIFSETQTVVIAKVVGKVEIMPPEGIWISAEEGMSLETGAVISTGFKSHASVEVGASTLIVNPLTRMKLEDFIQQNDVQTTSLYLRVGRIKVDVKTTEGLSHDFKVKSPYATASVRGTSFVFDGENLFVDKGMVALSNALNHVVSVGPQEQSQAQGNQKPKPAKKLKEIQSNVSPVAVPSKGKQKEEKQLAKEKSRKPGKKEQAEQYGEIVIRWKL